MLGLAAAGAADRAVGLPVWFCLWLAFMAVLVLAALLHLLHGLRRLWRQRKRHSDKDQEG